MTKSTPPPQSSEWLHDILDTIDQRSMELGSWSGAVNEAVQAIEAKFREARVEAEGRGRAAVLNAVKEWADDTEVSYNKMMETELEKIAELNSPRPKADRG